MKIRPLGKTRTVLENLGLEIMHFYDDLIFVNHTAYLFRFDDENENHLFMHFNVDCDITDKPALVKSIIKDASSEGFSITRSSEYEMVQKGEKEELQIVFKD